MYKIIYNIKKYISNKCSIVLFIICFQFTLGCSNHYGRLAVSGVVESQFENYQILSDHSYYYSGSRARPRAVIGVHKDYSLQSRFWNPIALTSEQLKNWVDYRGPNTKYFQAANGSDILSDRGEKIGVWYAFIDWRDRATVKMIDDRIVNISTPITHPLKYRPKLHGITTQDLRD